MKLTFFRTLLSTKCVSFVTFKSNDFFLIKKAQVILIIMEYSSLSIAVLASISMNLNNNDNNAN